jgi:TldD protein
MLPDESLASDLLREMTSSGADYADLFAQRTYYRRVLREGGQSRTLSTGEEAGAGLRIHAGGRTLFSAVSSLEPDRLLARARALAAEAGGAGRSRCEPFRPQGGGDGEKCRDPEWAQALLLEGESELAAAGCPEERSSSILSLSDGLSVVANSRGAFCRERRANLTLYQQVTVLEGGRSGYAAQLVSGPGTLGADPVATVRRAAREALQTARHRLAAVPAPSGSFPVVLGPKAAGLFLHEAVGHAFEGDFVVGGGSPFSRRLGERVAGAPLELWDDGTLEGGCGTARCDDEGTATGRALLLREGRLAGYLLDLASAEALSLAPTGHGRRASYRHPPLPRQRNLAAAPGSLPTDALAEEVEFGLLVLQMGGGWADIPGGDFAFRVTEGFLLREGKRGEPVRGALLRGNGPRALLALKAIGSEMGAGDGTCLKQDQGVPVSDRAPALLLESLEVTAEEGP